MLESQNSDTVHAFIRVSPCIYESFRTGKDYILSRLARGLFHPCALLDALGVARLAELVQPLPCETAIALMRIPLHDRQRQLFRNTSLSRSIALCKFFKLISFFIDDYAKNSLPILVRQGKGQVFDIETEYNATQLDASTYNLSVSEIARLQRAFCRFELYVQLFRVCCGAEETCKWSTSDWVPVEHQVEGFLSHFSATELTEIHCVRDYLHRRLRGMLDKVEDEAVAAPHKDYYEQESDCVSDVGSPYLFRYYGGKEGQDGNIKHLMCLGLEYVQRIFTSAGNERRDLMLHGGDACCPGITPERSITEALQFTKSLHHHLDDGTGGDKARELKSLIEDEDKSSSQPTCESVRS